MDKVDILDDLKNSISEEKNHNILKKILLLLSIIGFIAVIGSIIFSWYENSNKNSLHKEESLMFVAVKNIQNPEDLIKQKGSKLSTQDIDKIIQENIKNLESLFLNGKTMYAGMAGLYLANMSSLSKDYNKAIYYYERVSQSSSVNRSIRDYAALLMLNIKLNFDETFTNDEAIKFIDQYLEKNKKENIFFNEFELIKAAIMNENKNYEEASKIISNLIQKREIMNKNQDNAFPEEEKNQDDLLKGMLNYINYETETIVLKDK